MTHRAGFWSGMPTPIKFRFLAGLAFLGVSLFVLAQAPLLGIALLMSPILWTVFVIWLGSESGAGFGPYSRKRETAFTYVLRYVWRTSGFVRVLLSVALLAIAIGGLGWIGTEGLRVEAAKPSFSERVTQTTDAATQTTRETVSGWVSSARGWFGAKDEGQSSP